MSDYKCSSPGVTWRHGDWVTASIYTCTCASATQNVSRAEVSPAVTWLGGAMRLCLDCRAPLAPETPNHRRCLACWHKQRIRPTQAGSGCPTLASCVRAQCNADTCDCPHCDCSVCQTRAARARRHRLAMPTGPAQLTLGVAA